jgi:hypothetical protein
MKSPELFSFIIEPDEGGGRYLRNSDNHVQEFKVSGRPDSTAMKASNCFPVFFVSYHRASRKSNFSEACWGKRIEFSIV